MIDELTFPARKESVYYILLSSVTGYSCCGYGLSLNIYIYIPTLVVNNF